MKSFVLTKFVVGFMIIFQLPVFASDAISVVGEAPYSEISDPTHSQVIIREHPRTGKPYVSIVNSDHTVPSDPFTQLQGKYSRPDYRLLDPNINPKDIGYEGPYNDRTKVYIFGATLIAVGITGGVAGMALAPAAASAGAASGGGGAYLAAGTALTGAAGIGVGEMTKIRPEDENFTHESETKVLELKEGLDDKIANS